MSSDMSHSTTITPLAKSIAGNDNKLGYNDYPSTIQPDDLVINDRSSLNIATGNNSTTSDDDGNICIAVPQASANRMDNALFHSYRSNYLSTSSMPSVEGYMETKRYGQDQILNALGFGSNSVDSSDPLMRIPSRFFEHQSNAKGMSVVDVIQMRRCNSAQSQRKCLHLSNNR